MDAEIGSEALSQIVDFMERNPQCGCAQGEINDAGGSFYIPMFREMRLSFSMKKLSLIPTIYGCCYIVRSKVYFLVGGYDKSFFIYIDDARFFVSPLDNAVYDIIRAGNQNVTIKAVLPYQNFPVHVFPFQEFAVIYFQKFKFSRDSNYVSSGMVEEFFDGSIKIDKGRTQRWDWHKFMQCSISLLI